MSHPIYRLLAELQAGPASQDTQAVTLAGRPLTLRCADNRISLDAEHPLLAMTETGDIHWLTVHIPIISVLGLTCGRPDNAFAVLTQLAATAAETERQLTAAGPLIAAAATLIGRPAGSVLARVDAEGVHPIDEVPTRYRQALVSLVEALTDAAYHPRIDSTRGREGEIIIHIEPIDLYAGACVDPRGILTAAKPHLAAQWRGPLELDDALATFLTEAD